MAAPTYHPHQEANHAKRYLVCCGSDGAGGLGFGAGHVVQGSKARRSAGTGHLGVAEAGLRRRPYSATSQVGGLRVAAMGGAERH